MGGEKNNSEQFPCRFTQVGFARCYNRALFVEKHYPEITSSKAKMLVSDCLSTDTELSQYLTVVKNINEYMGNGEFA